jgi:hypothetical protein
MVQRLTSNCAPHGIGMRRRRAGLLCPSFPVYVNDGEDFHDSDGRKDAWCEVPIGPMTSVRGADNVSIAGPTRFPEKLSGWYRRYLGRGPGAGRGVERHMRAPLRWFFDRLDEHRARRLRSALGRRQWLVSWDRLGDGCWRARLSCPSFDSTLERTGKSRARAIGRASRALTLLLAFRGKMNRRATRTGRDPDSPDDAWR